MTIFGELAGLLLVECACLTGLCAFMEFGEEWLARWAKKWQDD
jgi:hypothetical protein